MNLNAEKWETVASEPLVKDVWIDLRVDTAKTPKGQLVERYYVLDYPAWVHIVAFNEKNELLVIRQFRYAINRNIYEIPCGMSDDGETPYETAVRELREETGFTFESVKEIGKFSANPSSHTNYVYVFLATGSYTEQPTQFDETEDIEHEFMSMDSVNEAIKNGTFCNTMAISSLYLAKML
jgi:8-oxo-dGTP pyrophosphatase MutT (NUDIX family)